MWNLCHFLSGESSEAWGIVTKWWLLPPLSPETLPGQESTAAKWVLPALFPSTSPKQSREGATPLLLGHLDLCTVQC